MVEREIAFYRECTERFDMTTLGFLLVVENVFPPPPLQVQRTYADYLATTKIGRPVVGSGGFGASFVRSLVTRMFSMKTGQRVDFVATVEEAADLLAPYGEGPAGLVEVVAQIRRRTAAAADDPATADTPGR